MPEVPDTARQLRSLVRDDGTVELRLVEVPVPTPEPDQVLVQVEATPINPSDLGLLFGPADLSTVERSDGDGGPVVTATIPPGARAAVAARVGQSLPAGNEGGGTVVAAGSSPRAQALLGRVVAMFGGSMYADYRCLDASAVLAMPDGVEPAQAASCFVNPLTALGMVETMRRQGHRALVHTAAASNLGQMLVRLCQEDGVDLVNIVRRPEQVELLRSLGAIHVCDSSSEGFTDDLTQALGATSATVAFDAVGGGELAGQILAAMEAAIAATSSGFSRYGSSVHKQVYIYGGLDRGPTVVKRTFGMAWGVGGWLLPYFLDEIGPEAAEALRQRVAREVTTTFASTYTAEIDLDQMLDPAEIARYARQATGQKYLVRPNGRAGR